MKIFISYSRADRPFVDGLIPRIARVYREVWFDRDLRGGQDWWDEILRQIAACDVFIFLMSNDSIASDYCRKEFAYAHELGKAILPVLARARTTVPPELARLQHVDMSKGPNDADALTDLMAALDGLRPARNAPAAPPTAPAAGPLDWTPDAPKPDASASPVQQGGSGSVQQNIGQMSGGMVIGRMEGGTVVGNVTNSTVNIGVEAQEREARRKQLLRQKRALEEQFFERRQVAHSGSRPPAARLAGLLVGGLGVAIALVYILLSESDALGLVIGAVALALAAALLLRGGRQAPGADTAGLEAQIKALEDQINKLG